MKLLFDFFPVLLFFMVFKAHDDPHTGMMRATAVIIAATLLQVGWTWWKHRRLERMHVITLGLVVLFGGATLLLQDELFIKWKPTIANWLFAAVFAGSHFIGGKPLVQRMMEAQIAAPRQVFATLNAAWVAFFVLMGALNLYVAYAFSTDTWVNFKFYGLLGLTIAFVIGQGFYLARHATETPDQPEKP
jgi:intracellular septation protein